MKILVTGAAGFLGSHFVAELKQHGHEVVRCDTKLGFDAHQIFARRLLVNTTFDLVVHCAAAEPHRRAIDVNPNLLAANLHLDAGLFDWAVKTEQRRVLYISSCAAYPADLQHGHPRRALSEFMIDPGRVEQPPDNYGWTKLTGEKMALAAQEAGLPVHIVRPFSGYGETQAEHWPFGAFIGRARRREDPFTIWGDASQVRDWIHVSDLISGALAVVEADIWDPVNLCTGNGTSMAQLASLVCKEAGYEPDILLRDDLPPGVAYRVGDTERMHDVYAARVSIEEGVRRALAHTSATAPA